MSAVWVRLAVLLCLSSTVQSGPAAKTEVLWKDAGGFITIQCRCEKDQDMLYVKKDLNKNVDVFFRQKEEKKATIMKGFQGRLQVAGSFPNLDIVIKNLTSADTGPFWCVYASMNNKTDLIYTEGTGSVLLVVAASKKAPTATCDPSTQSLVPVSVMILAAVLLCIILGFLIWCIKKTGRTATKPRRVPNNDVYEDMRATLRR
ncbi:uncharacterized protein LOC114859909 isoform X2 [Betta splendens]|uniref:Uncharacterized protein LOC114859909 isoform X2 n=1 Tax=Betta splendens TaxID=158456 RepID=A0A6P7N3C8_BETSP|nr:uncharacterized protein LOC114859909 isoform X2 [Betta splendens]